MPEAKSEQKHETRVTIRLVIPRIKTDEVWNLQDLVRAMAETYGAITYEVILSAPRPEISRG